MDKFYLTTTLPYVNAEPHIGHTLEFVQADIMARYMRKKLGAENVFFNVGADENGSKIYNKALEVGKTTREFVDFYAGKLKDFCASFNISYDNFYRTSDEGHVKVVQSFWKKCLENGDVYKKKYEGLYCVGCEAFKTEKDLVDGKCPDHGKAPVFYSEENYFFKLSKYKDELSKYIKTHRMPTDGEKEPFVYPLSKVDELNNFVKDMEDISISRLKKNLPWGIEAPDDSEQVVYVWFDALSNYLGAIGFPDNLNQDFADNMYQICGPDNLRFQGGIWQGMLMSAGFKNSKSIIVHGTILGPDGAKMSKTVGNVISPFAQLDKYGYEAIRFYLASSFGFGNSPYKEDDLVNLYNSILADSFGNLLNRVIHLANAKNVKINNFDDDGKNIEEGFRYKINDCMYEYNRIMAGGNGLDGFDISLAMDNVRKLSAFGNEYIQQNEPWAKDKDIKDIERVLNNLSYLLSALIDCYEPVIPESCEKARNALENREKIILFNKI